MTHLENKLTAHLCGKEYGRAHPRTFPPNRIPLSAVQEVIEDYLEACDYGLVPRHETVRAEFKVSPLLQSYEVHIAWYVDLTGL